MTTDYEELGREAVRLGMPEWAKRERWWSRMRTMNLDWCDKARDYRLRAPYFGDRPTALVCIPWVQAVAREVHGELADVRIEFGATVTITVSHRGRYGFAPSECDAHTLAEACIAAVKSMRGES